MTYDKLIKTVSEIVENENIDKDGLSLVYHLGVVNHKKMNETLFYKSNPITIKFIPTDEFEVEIGGILVKFLKKIEE
jgi:hypothetical protein